MQPSSWPCSSPGSGARQPGLFPSDYLALKGCNGTLKRFTNQPAILIGKRIESVDRLLCGLAVKLDIPPCAMPAWFALPSGRKCLLGHCRFARAGFPARKVDSVGKGFHLLDGRCRGV